MYFVGMLSCMGSSRLCWLHSDIETNEIVASKRRRDVLPDFFPPSEKRSNRAGNKRAQDEIDPEWAFALHARYLSKNLGIFRVWPRFLKNLSPTESSQMCDSLQMFDSLQVFASLHVAASQRIISALSTKNHGLSYQCATKVRKLLQPSSGSRQPGCMVIGQAADDPQHNRGEQTKASAEARRK